MLLGSLIILITVKFIKYSYTTRQTTQDDRYISKISPFELGEFTGFNDLVTHLNELNPCKSIYQQNQTLFKTIIKQQSYNLMKSIYIKNK